MNPTTTSWNDTQKILAFVIVAAFILVVILWMFFPPKGDPGTIAVLNTLVGALVTMAVSVSMFYFGSSRGERTKDTTIAQQLPTDGSNGKPTAPAAAPPTG